MIRLKSHSKNPRDLVQRAYSPVLAPDELQLRLVGDGELIPLHGALREVHSLARNAIVNRVEYHHFVANNFIVNRPFLLIPRNPRRLDYKLKNCSENNTRIVFTFGYPERVGQGFRQGFPSHSSKFKHSSVALYASEFGGTCCVDDIYATATYVDNSSPIAVLGYEGVAALDIS